MNPRTLRTARLIIAVVVLVLVYLVDWRGDDTSAGREAGSTESGELSVEQAFSRRLSDIMVRVEGEVDRILADDREGSRHQRFIVEAASGTTVLVAHNIDLAERVPLREGDRIEVFGEYEWNDRGGVLHWTHHDPQGRRAGGWIRHQGREYR